MPSPPRHSSRAWPRDYCRLPIPTTAASWSQLHLQLKEYAKAIEFGNRYIASAPEPPADMLALVAQAQYLLPDYAGSVAT